MSTGNPPQGSPGRSLLQVNATRPAVNSDGTLSEWFAQFLVRLVNQVGPVGGTTGTGTSGSSITDILNNLSTGQSSAIGSAGTDAATLARVQTLENKVTRIPPMALPVPAVLSNALDQAFGQAWGDVIYRGQYQWQVLPPAPGPNYVLTSGGPNANVFWAYNSNTKAAAFAALYGGVLVGLSTDGTNANVLSTGP